MSVIIDGEEYFTRSELGKRLEKFVEKTAFELENELEQKSSINLVSHNLA